MVLTHLEVAKSHSSGEHFNMADEMGQVMKRVAQVKAKRSLAVVGN